ncbi:hypothetical protein QVD17_38999 [Tagetes erecta]|uniref:Uncharacterized protein n=1 Tax=Tagetes erecta TaxID=13708 RepID=A0AAD8JPX0_TARER|nr:hypothetical protein QVD17_38999 [Tagetes erecta]
MNQVVMMALCKKLMHDPQPESECRIWKWTGWISLKVRSEEEDYSSSDYGGAFEQETSSSLVGRIKNRAQALELE